MLLFPLVKRLSFGFGFLGLVASCGIPQNSEKSQLAKTEFFEQKSLSLPAVLPQDVIVQLFNWPFRKITAEIPSLAAMGYAQIHVSPPNLTMDSDQWWGRYQPVDYRLIAGPLGNEQEFTAMIAMAHQHGIKIIVDVVFNHMANERSPVPKESAELKQRLGPLFRSADFHSPFCIGNYNDEYEVRNGRLCGGSGDQGMPDLDQSSAHVLQVQQEFLSMLTQMGVDGFRLDAVKHMEPGYFNQLLTPEVIGKAYVFGEIIADASSYERDLAPYMQATSMSFYDFPLRDTLQKALDSKGSLADLVDIGNVGARKVLPWNRSVSFIMNHDIPNNDGFRSMILDPADEHLAYAYLLGRSEGIPYVFSDQGIQGGGGIRDDRWAYAHRSPALASMVYFHNAAHGTDMHVVFADSCLLIFTRGDVGLVGINKCSEDFSGFVEAGLIKGQDYQELLQGQELLIEGGFVNLQIPGRSAVMFVKANP